MIKNPLIAQSYFNMNCSVLSDAEDKVLRNPPQTCFGRRWPGVYQNQRRSLQVAIHFPSKSGKPSDYEGGLVVTQHKDRKILQDWVVLSIDEYRK